MESAFRRIFKARQSAPNRRCAAEHAAWPADGEVQRLAASLREKDALLREAHHRVNNNMQMVSSLLQLQANYIEDPKLLELFQECGGRVRTMVLLHQKASRSGPLAQIDFKECLESLADTLLRTKSNGVKVMTEFNLEPVVLSIETAVPVGLIANELISNSLKHAFVGRQEGLLRVSLGRRGQDHFRLAIGDDGSGGSGRILESNSLGLRLVKILTGQIHGQMEYKNESGAEFVIVFKDTSSNST